MTGKQVCSQRKKIIVDPKTRGGRRPNFDLRGHRDPVSHRRPPDLGTPELQAKRAAMVAKNDIEAPVLQEAIRYLSEPDPRKRKIQAVALSPATKVLLSQKADAALSIHPLGAMHARGLIIGSGQQVVTEDGLRAAVRYAELHHRVFSSRRTQVSRFFRVYVAHAFEGEQRMSDLEIKKLAATETRLTRAEDALRAAGGLSRRLVRDMAIFDRWPTTPAGSKHPGTDYDRHMKAINRGLGALERVLLGASRRPDQLNAR